MTYPIYKGRVNGYKQLHLHRLFVPGLLMHIYTGNDVSRLHAMIPAAADPMPTFMPWRAKETKFFDQLVRDVQQSKLVGKLAKRL
jgi:hypothetical protein